jgi:hypothetical protein
MRELVVKQICFTNVIECTCIDLNLDGIAHSTGRLYNVYVHIYIYKYAIHILWSIVSRAMLKKATQDQIKHKENNAIKRCKHETHKAAASLYNISFYSTHFIQ